MLKTKIFNFFADKFDDYQQSETKFIESRNQHEKEIDDFIQQLSFRGHTFINMNSVAYGRFGNTNRVRTIIVYFENPSRKIIFEKIKQDD